VTAPRSRFARTPKNRLHAGNTHIRQFRPNQRGAHRFDAAMGFRMIRATPMKWLSNTRAARNIYRPYGIVHGGVHCAAVEIACSTGRGSRDGARQAVGRRRKPYQLHPRRARRRVRVTATPITAAASQVWGSDRRDESGRTVSTGRVRLLCLDPETELAGEKVRVKGRRGWPEPRRRRERTAERTQLLRPGKSGSQSAGCCANSVLASQ